LTFNETIDQDKKYHKRVNTAREPGLKGFVLNTLSPRGSLPNALRGETSHVSKGALYSH
jgi:hypothetical protein